MPHWPLLSASAVASLTAQLFPLSFSLLSLHYVVRDIISRRRQKGSKGGGITAVLLLIIVIFSTTQTCWRNVRGYLISNNIGIIMKGRLRHAYGRLKNFSKSIFFLIQIDSCYYVHGAIYIY